MGYFTVHEGNTSGKMLASTCLLVDVFPSLADVLSSGASNPPKAASLLRLESSFKICLSSRCSRGPSVCFVRCEGLPAAAAKVYLTRVLGATGGSDKVLGFVGKTEMPSLSVSVHL
jgi:hypothetical protein